MERKGKERGRGENEERQSDTREGEKKDEQTAVGGSDRDHQLTHTYSSLTPSHHLSIITPFQRHSKSLHRPITYKIIDMPACIHLSSTISFMHFSSLPICSSISLPPGPVQSVSAILLISMSVCVYVTNDINLASNANSKGGTAILSNLIDDQIFFPVSCSVIYNICLLPAVRLIRSFV